MTLTDSQRPCGSGSSKPWMRPKHAPPSGSRGPSPRRGVKNMDLTDEELLILITSTSVTMSALARKLTRLPADKYEAAVRELEATRDLNHRLNDEHTSRLH